MIGTITLGVLLGIAIFTIRYLYSGCSCICHDPEMGNYNGGRGCGLCRTEHK